MAEDHRLTYCGTCQEAVPPGHRHDDLVVTVRTSARLVRWLARALPQQLARVPRLRSLK